MKTRPTTGLLRRCTTVILCAALLLSICSCALSSSNVTPTAESSVSTPSPGVTTSVSAAAPPVNPSADSVMFITNLTENGTGLVRDVGPESYTQSTLPLWNGFYDVRWLDCPKHLSADDTQKLLDAVPNISFNSDTVWPESLPSDFDPAAIMEAGKNPGLGVNSLHESGITGKGVSLAIIDLMLFTGHAEYKDNLALYEEIHVLPGDTAAMHASAVASIAVGKNCGVAPEAKLYYWAVNFAKGLNITSGEDVAFGEGLAVAIDRMLEINTMLPASEKIRVLSISCGFSDLSDEGVQTFLEAIERAKEAGIFVITTSTFQYCDFMTESTDFAGLGKTDFAGDPDDLSTYTLGSWQLDSAPFFVDKLLVPKDARTTADFTGADDYVFYVQGGWSWVAPYLAGLYALAAQVKPDITPEIFWTTALDTANKMTRTINNISYTFNHVLNPPALIDALQ